MEENYYKKYEPIDGKWYIKELLGEGSYGKVFRIEREDISGKKSAALKAITIPQSKTEISTMRESLCDEQSVKEYYKDIAGKLLNEFNLMAKLKENSNIVSYEDHNIEPHEDGIGYDILIRMELLTPLSEYFENGIDEKDVIRLGIDICKALEICQQYEIVHRDIKPENIFVSQSGSFKLGDFGVAKTMKSIETVMTKAGTYKYMAPELYKGEKSGASVDIYSLGMVMYQLLNYNREPFLPTPPERFTFEQKENALMQRMKGDSLPKSYQASETLSEVILKACSFNPDERYKSPLEMYDALNLIQDKEKHIIEDIANSYDNYNLIENDEFDKNEETVGLFDIKKESVQQSEEKIINKTEKTQSIIDIYKEFWTGYFDFKGCISRINYWKIVLINFIILNIVNILSDILPVLNILLFIMCLAILIPNIALTTCRLHDVGKSGHWQWLYLTLFGNIAIFVFLCQKSQTNNKYRNKGAE